VRYRKLGEWWILSPPEHYDPDWMWIAHIGADHWGYYTAFSDKCTRCRARPPEELLKTYLLLSMGITSVVGAEGARRDIRAVLQRREDEGYGPER
jgi:hypothetical protein